MHFKRVGTRKVDLGFGRPGFVSSGSSSSLRFEGDCSALLFASFASLWRLRGGEVRHEDEDQDRMKNEKNCGDQLQHASSVSTVRSGLVLDEEALRVELDTARDYFFSDCLTKGRRTWEACVVVSSGRNLSHRSTAIQPCIAVCRMVPLAGLRAKLRGSQHRRGK